MVKPDDDRLSKLDERVSRLESRLLDLEQEIRTGVRHDRTTRRVNMWIRIAVYALGLLFILFFFFLTRWDIINF